MSVPAFFRSLRFLRRSLVVLSGLLGVSLLVTGCEADTPAEPADVPVKKVEVAKNVTLEVAGEKRRVIVGATVCLREGPLEGLLTRKNTKEHEYILSADVDAREIHKALILARAKPGSPVVFLPKYQAAHGSTIKISLRYTKAGKVVTESARAWIRDNRTKQAIDTDWVFGGSRLVPNEEDNKKPPIYLANFGDLVCLCNMDTAMLDVPVPSPKKFDSRVYEAFTDKIPEKETRVDVIFEVVPGVKK